MKTFLSLLFLAPVLNAVPAAPATAPAVQASAPEKARPGAYALELWKDPNFAKFFLGTYSVFPDVEPPLSDKDRELLNQLLPMMSKPVEAAGALVKLITKDTNAIFDLTLGSMSRPRKCFSVRWINFHHSAVPGADWEWCRCVSKNGWAR